MTIEVITKQDLQNLRAEILADIMRVFAPEEKSEWLKSADVCKVLNCSPGTLQNFRIRGVLPFKKLEGTIYYKRSDVDKMLS